jgi:hypothetical protein
LTTPAGQRLRASVMAMKDPAEGGFFKNRKIMNERMADVGKNFGALANESGGLSNVMRAKQQEITAAGKFWGRAAGAGARGLGTVGSMATMGLVTGPAAVAAGGAAAVAGVGYAYYRGQKKEEEAAETGGKDAYRMFNDFAEKAGIATKGLVSFSQALAESTSKIAAIEPTKGTTAYSLTDQERLQAQAPGYERAYSTRGDSFWDKVMPSNFNAGKEGLRIRGMLGENASDEAINRVQMDLVNQLGEEKANAAMAAASGLEGKSSKEIEDMLSGAGNKSRTLGIFGSTESAEFKEMAEAERARRVNMEKSIYGEGSVTAKGYAGAETGLEAAKKEGTGRDAEERRNKGIDEAVTALNLSSKDSDKLRETMQRSLLIERSGGEKMSLPEMMRAAGLDTVAASYEQGLVGTGMASGAGQYRNMTEEQKAATSVSAGETAAKKSVDLMSDFGFATGSVATELAGTAKTIRTSGKSLEDWTAAVEKGEESATDLEKAWADVKLAPGDVNAQNRLANLAATRAIEDAQKTGGGTQQAMEILQTAMTTSTGAEIPGLQQAQQIVQAKQAITDFAKPRLQQQTERIQAGKNAEAFLLTPEAEGLTQEQRAGKQAAIDEGVKTQADMMNQQRDYYVQRRRQQEDFQKSVARMTEQFEKSQQYAAEDYGKQRKYMIQDYHRSVLRAEEDFHQARARAQRDFDKQVKRQSEQTAKNMFDPYSRLPQQIVTDMGVLQQSLLEQNKSVSDQLSSVDKLAGMGLSKDAIDQLKLMDPSQNAQVQRMLADAMTNPDGINQINDLIKKRLKLGNKLSTSEYNKDFQNMKEDFGTSMDDMSDDFEKNMKRGHQDFKRGLKRNGDAFATAQNRAAEAHQTALNQMNEDNKTAQDRSFEDLTGLAKEYTESYTGIEKKFLKDLADLPSNLSPATKKAIKAVLEDEIEAIESANTKATTGGVSASAAPPYAMGTPNGGGPTTPGPAKGGGDSDIASFFLNRIGDSKIIGLGAGHDHPSFHSVAGRCLQNASWAKRYLGDYVHHSGYPTAVSVGHALGRENQLHPGYNAPAGAFYWWNGSIGGGSGHVAISDGHGGAINNWGSNHIERNRVSSMSPRAFMGWSTYKSLNTGGIVDGPTRALIGEAGREAIIPLNDKGTQYLADAMSKASMGRYWKPSEAAGARAAGHSSPVTNNVYSYDQRTQFTGEVHVEAQDPEAMANKLAQRERRNRLARKTGSVA